MVTKGGHSVHAIFPYIREHFLAKEAHFRVFSQADSRLEGWFKGEMPVLLETHRAQGMIQSYERELNVPTPMGPKQRRQIDFRVRVGSRFYLCELKAMCTSQAAGTPRDLHFYLRDDDVGMIKDLKQLPQLPVSDSLWLLAFVYPAPKLDEWDAALENIHALAKDCRCTTSPKDCPSFL